MGWRHFPDPPHTANEVEACSHVFRVAFPHCPGEGWGQLCAVLGHLHSPSWQPRPGMSARPLVVTGATDIHPDPCCYSDVDPDMTLSGSMSRDISRASVGSAGSYIRLFLSTLVSPLLPLFAAQTLPLLFLAQLSTTFLLTIVALDLACATWQQAGSSPVSHVHPCHVVVGKRPQDFIFIFNCAYV